MVNCIATVRHHRLRPGEVVLGCLPTSHVNGLHFTLFSVICAGAHVVMSRDFDPGAYTQLAKVARPRIASVVPSILNSLLDRPSAAAFESLEYFVSAAAPLSNATAAAVRQRLHKTVVQSYGLTETMNFSTSMPIHLGDEAYQRWMEKHDPPPVGSPMFGTEVAIFRADGTPAAIGEPGEICMRGHSLMSGYLGNYQATAEAFAHGWFHSGDSGWLQSIAPGCRALFIRGRQKNIVKVGGYGVSLEEVDRALLSISGIIDAAAFAVADAVLGEAIEAVVVKNNPSLTARAIRQLVASTLPRPGVPVTIHFRPRLPRSATGKLNRGNLRELVGLQSG
jgi:acyl-CoA synthetase (AMP-forming)/AMP-acid ligase II